jgi:hypothetical protein
MRFPIARMDRPTRLITVSSVLLLLLGLPLVTLGEPGAALVPFIGAALVLVVFGFSPAAYEVDGAVLRVRRRLFGARTFQLTGPATRAPWTVGLGGIRLGATAGLFGWFGTFHKIGHGRYRAYLTDRSRIVACTTDRGLVLLSPADPDALLAALASSPAGASR